MEIELRWQAPEFEYHRKGSAWYLWVVAAATAIVGLALLQGNFLFIVFTLIAAALVMRWGSQTPRNLDFTLTGGELIIDNKKVYPYEELAGFAVHGSQLVFRKKHRLGTYVKVLFPVKRAEEIRNFLTGYLPEVEYEDSLTDHISRLLRF